MAIRVKVEKSIDFKKTIDTSESVKLKGASLPPRTAFAIAPDDS